MTMTEVSAHDYANIFSGKIVYNTVGFSLLNESKCDRLRFLVFGDKKARLGLILGEKSSVLKSPFSAPFGGFISLRNQPAKVYIEAIEELKNNFTREKAVIITLPPYFYDEDNIAKTAFALEYTGAECQSILNYHCNLDDYATAEDSLSPDQRRNYRISLASGFTFRCLSSKECGNVSRIYDVIRRNREEKGYYLAMTLDEVIKTGKTVPADLFIVEKDAVDVAAALVYRVSDTVAQVIYWGDISSASRMHPMSLLSTNIFNYYKNAGLTFVDVGPAGDFNELNSGLCAYKERIGCTASVKRKYILKP